MHDIENADVAQLAEIKLWLFQESVRVQNEKRELDELKEAFDKEKDIIKKQLRDEGRMLEFKKKHIDDEQHLIDEKWKALKRGFEELDEDRRALKRQEKRLIEYRKELEELPINSHSSVTLFFRGVNDTLSLKKRYKDLLKIFHPDNIAGDKETVLSITQEYDNLKRQLM